MNTTTKAEQTALTLPQRAAVALGSSKTELDLEALVKQSADIVAVSNMAGRDQAHRIGMNLKAARVTIEKTAKAAREDATAFSKAVIAEEKRLIEIITPEEDRVIALRDAWDTQVENERQAKIQAEVLRMSAIASAIEAIREGETDALRICKTAEETQREIEYVEKREITAAIYQERLAEAVALKETVLTSMRTILAGRVAAEAAEAQRKIEAAAEAARIVAERAELEQLRAAATETARLAKIESDRVAAEQAAEAKRLAEQAIAQAAEMRAQAEAQAAQVRAEQAERDRVAAGVKAQLEQQAAQLAAERRALDEERAADAKAKADAMASVEKMQAPVEVERTGAGQLMHDGLQRRNAALASQGIDSAAPSATWPFPSLRLGQIGERLGFALTAEFLRSLGFEAAAKDRAAVLYHEHQFGHICAALQRHISAVQAKLAA
jgi:hypothetical protein